MNKLSEIFVEYAKENIDDVAPETLEKYKSAPFRAPMVIILVTNVTEHPKVPEIEQMLSSATAGQNILLALNALNYSAIWRTGIFAFNEMVSQRMGLEENQKIYQDLNLISFLYYIFLQEIKAHHEYYDHFQRYHSPLPSLYDQ